MELGKQNCVWDRSCYAVNICEHSILYPSVILIVTLMQFRTLALLQACSLKFWYIYIYNADVCMILLVHVSALSSPFLGKHLDSCKLHKSPCPTFRSWQTMSLSMLTAKSISWESARHQTKKGGLTISFQFHISKNNIFIFIYFLCIAYKIHPKKKHWFGLDAKNLHSPYFQLPWYWGMAHRTSLPSLPSPAQPAQRQRPRRHVAQNLDPPGSASRSSGSCHRPRDQPQFHLGKQGKTRLRERSHIPPFGKGKSCSKVHWGRDMLVPRRVNECLCYHVE